MGCSSSSEMKRPNNPLDEMLFREMESARLQRKLEKEQKQMEKAQKKLQKRLKKKRQNSYPNDVQIRTSQSSKPRSSNASIASKSFERKNREKISQQLMSNIEQKLNKDLCGLLFDQITCSIEFFGSYESELTSILAEFIDKENAYNENLEDQSILLTNPLDAAVAKWINYKPTHGPDKSNPQPMQVIRIYVVFENIDISRPNDANYDSISPLCKVNMEMDSYRTTPCKEEHMDLLREIKWKGYVRLKLRDDPKNDTPALKAYSKAPESKAIYGTRAVSMTSSGYGTEGDYDYVYITKLNTHHPLAELKMNNKRERKQLHANVLPESCVSRLGAYVDARAFDNSDDDDFETAAESEDDDDGNNGRRKSKAYRDFETTQAIKRYKQEQEKRRQLLQQRYLNSKEFMRYFGELMRQKLVKQLSLSLSELKQATYCGASIYVKDYEIVPAIHVAQNAQSWPECANQFRLRERPIKKHPVTGQKVQWPTRVMLKQIESFGYHVVPLGYAPKKYRNPFREIEWRIVFPKAERYLECQLSQTQVKVFMMMKALVKTFVEPVETDKALMFAMDHLRTHLFWECERDFTAWPEEFIGDVLLRFLDTFMSRLRQKRLRDYFIEERNLFESVPEDSLMSLYLIMSDIKSNPLMHLMVAFRNLDFNEKFFPKLNFKKIFQTLSGEGMVELKKLSKNCRIMLESDEDDYEGEEYMMDPTGLLGTTNEKTTGKLRRRTIQLKYEIEAQQEEDKKRRGSIESIDVEFFFNNELRSKSNVHINQGVENLRRTNLIEILLDHYLGVMKKAIKFRNISLIQGWKAQAERLTTFYNDYGCDVGAKDYEDSIAMIEDILEEIKVVEGFREDSPIPALPNRLSLSGKKENKKKIAETNPYEEVLPADNNLPPLQNAMKAWETRLQIRREEDNQSGESTPESESSKEPKAIIVEVHKSDVNIEIEQTITNNGKDEEKTYALKKECSKQHFKELRKIISEEQNAINEINTENSTGSKNKPIKSATDSEDSEKEMKSTQRKNYAQERVCEDSSDDESIDSVYQTKPTAKKSRKPKKVDYQETSNIEYKTSRQQRKKSKEEKVESKKNDGRLDSDYDSCREDPASSDEASKSSSEESHKSEKSIPVPRKSVTFKKAPTKIQKRRNDNENLHKNVIDIEQIVEDIEDTDISDNSVCEKRSSTISFQCLTDISFKALEAQVELLNRKGSDSELQAVIVDGETRPPRASKKQKRRISRSSNNSIKLKQKKQRQREKRESMVIERLDWETEYSVDTADEDESELSVQIAGSNDKEAPETAKESSTDNKNPVEQSLTKKSLLGRIINTEELFKSLSIFSPSTVETVTESTQKIVTTLMSEEKRTQFRDTLKQKTIKLKGALFQSSET